MCANISFFLLNINNYSPWNVDCLLASFNLANLENAGQRAGQGIPPSPVTKDRTIFEAYYGNLLSNSAS